VRARPSARAERAASASAPRAAAHRDRRPAPPRGATLADAETTLKGMDTTGSMLGKSVSRLLDTRASADFLANDPAHLAELSELKRLDDQICTLRRKHDELAHSNMEKRQELERIADKLRDIAKDSVKAGQDPAGKEIRSLEKKLAASVARYEEAYENRRTYDQIMKRLKAERMGYDNKIAELDARLKAKEAEYEELLLLSHDANHSKEMAKAELARLEAIAVEERKLRDREVQEQKQLVLQKQEANKELAKREKAALSADQPHASEPLATVKRNQLYTTLADTGIDDEQKNIKAYEAAFQKIKEVTGVSDVSEVIEKFLTQEETHKHLVQMTRDSQARIEALHDQKRRAEEQVQRLKYTSSKPGGSRRPNARANGEVGAPPRARASRAPRRLAQVERAKPPALTARAPRARSRARSVRRAGGQRRAEQVRAYAEQARAHEVRLPLRPRRRRQHRAPAGG
jgi:myosin heavy subunit